MLTSTVHVWQNPGLLPNRIHQQCQDILLFHFFLLSDLAGEVIVPEKLTQVLLENSSPVTQWIEAMQPKREEIVYRVNH